VTGPELASLFDPARWPETVREAALASASAIRASAPYAPLEHLAAVVRAASFTADPAMSLANMARWLAARRDPAADLRLLAENTEHRHLVASFFAFSQFLAEIAIRTPDALDEEIAAPGLSREKGAAEYLAGVRRLPDAPGWEAALLAWQRRELLRIGLRDFQELAQEPIIVRELSGLADAVIAFVLERSYADLVARHGLPRDANTGEEAAFAVYGLGKLGARELNFSSDVDLVFVYDAEGETDGATDPTGRRIRRVSNHEFFNRLSGVLCGVLEGAGAQGRLYHVDTRLRPDGGAGPLARGLLGWSEYFERQGRPFERVAYLRARHIAGTAGAPPPPRPALRDTFDAIVRTFVYRDAALDELPAEIATLKRRIDMETLDAEGRELDVKRGRGGIREIEFLIALRQLQEGAHNPRLRHSGTLESLDRMTDAGLFPEQEAATLRDAYYVLRRIEHTLQMMNQEQTHRMPRDPRERARLALRCGWASLSAFEAMLESHRSFVADRFRAYVSGAGDEPPTLPEALEQGAALTDAMLAELRPVGLDGDEGQRILRELLTGSVSYAPSARGQRELELLLPRILEELRAVAYPRSALRFFDALLRASKGIALRLELLIAHPPALRLCLRVLGGGDETARLLVAHPEWLDLLLSGFGLSPVHDPAAELRAAWEAQGGPHRPPEESLADLRRLRQREAFLVAVRETLALVTTAEAAAQTTALAGACLRSAAEALLPEFRQRGDWPARWCIAAAGGLGSGDLHPTSDLDLLFWQSGEPSDSFDRFAARLCRELAALTPEGVLWRVDARLRPDGASGRMAATETRLLDYYAREAGVWEWVAMQKARPVAGDEAWGAEVLRSVRAAWPARRPEPRALAADLLAMRRRIEDAHRLPSFARYDLKQGPGGLWDIDFALAFHALREGGLEFLGEPRVGELIARLESAGILATDDAKALRARAAALRRVQRAVRQLAGTDRDIIPADEAERAALERLLAHRLDAHPAPVAAIGEEGAAVRVLLERTLAGAEGGVPC
jgi:glutamate-ammonia-ligase adenylyltransferase